MIYFKGLCCNLPQGTKGTGLVRIDEIQIGFFLNVISHTTI
jgi:hypothetical protein